MRKFSHRNNDCVITENIFIPKAWKFSIFAP